MLVITASTVARQLLRSSPLMAMVVTVNRRCPSSTRGVASTVTGDDENSRATFPVNLKVPDRSVTFTFEMGSPSSATRSAARRVASASFHTKVTGG